MNVIFQISTAPNTIKNNKLKKVLQYCTRLAKQTLYHCIYAINKEHTHHHLLIYLYNCKMIVDMDKCTNSQLLFGTNGTSYVEVCILSNILLYDEANLRFIYSQKNCIGHFMLVRRS